MRKYIFITIAVLGLISPRLTIPGAFGKVRSKDVFIPVLINVYPNADVNATTAGEVIRKVNEDLRKNANPSLGTMNLVPLSRTPTAIDPNSGGTGHYGGDNGDGSGTAGDGKLTYRPGANNDELDNVFVYGRKEIAATRNHCGIKICFVELPIANENTPGACKHCKPTMVVSLPKSKQISDLRGRGLSAADATAETVLHELGHILTLKAKHKITPHRNADNNGHAPATAMLNDPYGNGNFMAPGSRRTRTRMMIAQYVEMLIAARRKAGKSVREMDLNPPERVHRQFGTVADDAGDQEYGGSPVSPIYDLHSVYLSGTHESDIGDDDTEQIWVQMRVADTLPTYGEIAATYTLGFDIDNDTLTGVWHAGCLGIDRVVIVQVQGDISLGTFVVEGTIHNTVTGAWETLTTPVVETEDMFIDSESNPIPVETTFTFEIPKSFVNLLAVYVPVIATAGYGGDIYDSAEFEFDTERWLHDPTLTVFGTGIPTPGQVYPFEVSDLEPNSPFTLYLDDEPVLSDTLNPSGGYSGQFIFPTELSTTETHFLVAQDETGEFAYNVAPSAVQCGEWGYLSADLDENCIVNLSDLAKFADLWLSCTEPYNPDCVDMSE
ncbi:MAG: hypothetical protein ACYS9Y_04030 [Planctomycetota bacterium]|jgi:hypothetical protein